MSMITSPSVELSSYRDQHFKGTRAEQDKLLRISTTLYVGNLSFYTTEEQIYELFSKCGDIRRIIMGLDKYKKTPCGFCFVEYYTRADAENCLRYINGTRLDDRIVRTDWDAGFIEGRQYGRGKTGGQVVMFDGLSGNAALKSHFFVEILCVFMGGWLATSTRSTSFLKWKVRDEYRTDYDSGRGGYGKIIQQKIGGIETPGFLR